MSEISIYIHQHLTQYVDYSNIAIPVIDDSSCEQKCSRCDYTKSLYQKSSGKDKSLFCSACLFFLAIFPTYHEEKSMTIKQKDTLLIISPYKTIVVADISPKLFTSDHVKLIDPASLNKIHKKTWRNIISEFVLFDYKETNTTSLIILQSRADRPSTFKITHSPHYINLCGVFDERINAYQLNKGYEIVKDIPKEKWQEAITLKQRSGIAKLSADKLKKLTKHRETYPTLFDDYADEILPTPGSNAYYFLGWAQFRDQVA